MNLSIFDTNDDVDMGPGTYDPGYSIVSKTARAASFGIETQKKSDPPKAMRKQIEHYLTGLLGKTAFDQKPYESSGNAYHEP